METTSSLLAQLLPEATKQIIPPNLFENVVPYFILAINFVLFKLFRALSDALLGHQDERQPQQEAGFSKPLRLLVGELISTCELCADCAELNVIYEKHGAFAYAAGLFLLSYLWVEAFGEAHTSPGYLAEELCLIRGKPILASAETYARFIGQSMALPLAWRFASLYWQYQLVGEHKQMLVVENCKSALSTSTVKGFLIEFTCCLLCRLIELLGHRMAEQNKGSSVSKRVVSLGVAFASTLLVMLALELSGGYFNPILAASLEYGCKGIHFYQHAIVFWIGPLLGHVFARSLYVWFAGETYDADASRESGQSAATREQTKHGAEEHQKAGRAGQDGRPRRTTSQRRKRHRD